MKKMCKRVWTLLLVLALCLPILTGCSGNGDSSGDRTQLVFYLAGGLVAGQNDAAVKEAIEEKFYKDTGIKIDLKVVLCQNADINTKIDLAIAGGDPIDAIFNYVGSTSGLDRFVNGDEYFTDLTALIDQYGGALKKNIPQLAFDTCTYDGKIFAIPEAAQENIYGILIRKDWLDDAGLEIPTTITEFETALAAFRDREKNIVPMVGFHWDMDRVVLAGAYDCVQASYFYLDENGTILPGFLHPNYKKVLETEYRWIQEGLWDVDNASRTESSCDNLFIGGRAGVYIQYPEITHLIEISRKCKAANPEAEFEVIGPLKGEDGAASFQKSNVSFAGCLIPASSKNAEIVVKYFDWLASDPANYELAKYGREGYEWVDTGDGLMGIPEGAQDVLLTGSLYSGCYCSLNFTTVSDRIMDTYTQQELQWIEDVRSFNTYSDAREGVFWPDQDSDLAIAYANASDVFRNDILSPARAGLVDTSLQFESAVQAFKMTNAEYLAWMNRYYQENKPDQGDK